MERVELAILRGGGRRKRQAKSCAENSSEHISPTNTISLPHIPSSAQPHVANSSSLDVKSLEPIRVYETPGAAMETR